MKFHGAEFFHADGWMYPRRKEHKEGQKKKVHDEVIIFYNCSNAREMKLIVRAAFSFYIEPILVA